MSPEQEKLVRQIEARVKGTEPGPRRLVGDRMMTPRGPVFIAEASLTGPMAPALRGTVRPRASLRFLNQTEKLLQEHARDDLAFLLLVIKQQAAQIDLLTQAHTYVVDGVARETEQRRKAEKVIRWAGKAWARHIKNDEEMSGADVVEWLGLLYENIDLYWEEKATWNETMPLIRSARPRFTIPEMCWDPSGPDADPKLRMNASININGADFHFEAYRVKFENHTQLLDSDDEDHKSWFAGWSNEAGGDGPFETVTIFDREYVIFASPHT